MSSLQKFHRRTMSLAPPWPPTVIGAGDATRGYWLGGPTFNALVVAPKSTEVYVEWGSAGTVRGTTSTTNGLANTNTLYAFGSAAHPAAYAAKNLTTGGYNTWYLPAKDELNTLYSNKSATPFATANSFVDSLYLSSTDYQGNYVWSQYFSSGTQTNFPDGTKYDNHYVRATRRYTFPTATIGSGDSSNGYWLGTAGDGVSKLVVAPTSTETSLVWGSFGTVRGTISTTNGISNTNTLYAFGSAAHPAAYYCKTLTTGGYTTWYLPAINELVTAQSNSSAIPFSTAYSFSTIYPARMLTSSTEYNGGYAKFAAINPSNGITIFDAGVAKYSEGTVRAVRRV